MHWINSRVRPRKRACVRACVRERKSARTARGHPPVSGEGHTVNQKKIKWMRGGGGGPGGQHCHHVPLVQSVAKLGLSVQLPLVRVERLCGLVERFEPRVDTPNPVRLPSILLNHQNGGASAYICIKLSCERAKGHGRWGASSPVNIRVCWEELSTPSAPPRAKCMPVGSSCVLLQVRRLLERPEVCLSPEGRHWLQVLQPCHLLRIFERPLDRLQRRYAVCPRRVPFPGRHGWLAKPSQMHCRGACFTQPTNRHP